MEYDDVVTVPTPEGVDITLTLAGVGSRFVAALIDLTIQALLLIALTILLTVSDGFGTLGEGGGLDVAVYAIANFLVFWGYDVLFEVFNGGRTPGKQLNGLRVVRDEGQPVTFVSSAIRNVLRLVDFLPSAYLVGIVSIFVTRKNQRLGDIAAGTLVVRERRAIDRDQTAAAIAAAPREALGSSQWGAIDTSALTSEELAAVNHFLDRRHDVSPDARYELARTLAERLAPKVRGAPPGLTGERFLEAVAAARAVRSG